MARRWPLSHAPREIRTPTVQTDHKARNLARNLPDPSECRRRSERLDDPDLVDGAFVVTGWEVVADYALNRALHPTASTEWLR
jgi:hypothetical protein